MKQSFIDKLRDAISWLTDPNLQPLSIRMMTNTVANIRDAIRDAERLQRAVERACEESDYCYVCDMHPSTGHAPDCVLT